MTPAWCSSCPECCYSWLRGKVHGIYSVQRAGKCRVIQWSWWTVHGRKTLTAHITLVVSAFLCLHRCCWAGWRLFITTTKQNQQHTGAGVYSALWFKPPACLRPTDVGIQPWAVSFDSSSCPLFTISPRIGEEAAESNVHSKELKNQTTKSLVNSHSLKTLTECTADSLEFRLSKAFKTFWLFVVLRPTKINSALAILKNYSTVLLTVHDSHTQTQVKSLIPQ